jgi:hypothetical protein
LHHRWQYSEVAQGYQSTEARAGRMTAGKAFQTDQNQRRLPDEEDGNPPSAIFQASTLSS